MKMLGVLLLSGLVSGGVLVGAGIRVGREVPAEPTPQVVYVTVTPMPAWEPERLIVTATPTSKAPVPTVTPLPGTPIPTVAPTPFIVPVAPVEPSRTPAPSPSPPPTPTPCPVSGNPGNPGQHKGECK